LRKKRGRNRGKTGETRRGGEETRNEEERSS